MTDPLLATALRALGGDAGGRDRVVAACRVHERRFGLRGGTRDVVTGPIVDALFPPGTVVVKELADGSVFELSYRSNIARDFVLAPDDRPDHVWEPQTTRLLVHLATGGRRAAIGGGYVGDHAVFVARALGAGGTCTAFEPNAESARLMRRNAERNGVALDVSELALWNRSARIKLVGDDSHAHPEVSDDDDAITAVTLDDHAAANGWSDDALALYMLDIEGGETAALQGASGFLSRPAGEAPAVVFEVHRSYVDWTDGLAATEPVRVVLDHGYTVFAIRDFQSNVPMAGCKIELVPIDDIHLEGPPHGFNLVAVKDHSLLSGDRFRLCPGRSPKLLLHREPTLHHPTEWLDDPPVWLVGEG